ncbi:MarR family winged helix-turn-helix transcriptional regulator [Fusobacterium sp. PH5-44]|uniref:MarR family winged helix-turn-helix transcriptional regulator n=1 Tax=unclassified Fusobacterium TaxID=2648384 RepID=UPI003D1E2BB2
MKEKDNYELLNNLFSLLSVRADKLYEFIIYYYNNGINHKRDYGNGKQMRMLEIHALTYIEENPGTTANDLVKSLLKTKGAISATVKMLENAGLIVRKKENNNSKNIYLYATNEGIELSRKHKIYDVKDIQNTTKKLKENCTDREIDAFYKVIDTYLDILKNEQ